MGTITVEAMGGALTIDAGDGTFTLTDSRAKTDIDANTGRNSEHRPQLQASRLMLKALVTQESSLFFKGRNIVTERVVNRPSDYHSRH